MCPIIPESSQSSEEESLLSHLSTSQSLCTKFKKALAPFAQLTLILLVIAGSVRNGGRVSQSRCVIQLFRIVSLSSFLPHSP